MSPRRPRLDISDYWPRVSRPARDWTPAERERMASLRARVYRFAELAARKVTRAREGDDARP